MTAQYRRTDYRHAYLLSARSVIRSCLFLLVGFTLWCGHTAAIAGCSDTAVLIQPHYCIKVSLHSAGNSSSTFLPSCEFRLTHGQFEVFDEIGPNDDAPDSDHDGALGETSTDRRFDFISIDKLSAFYTEMSQSCSTICLFILHHSWKSFLS